MEKLPDINLDYVINYNDICIDSITIKFAVYLFKHSLKKQRSKKNE